MQMSIFSRRASSGWQAISLPQSQVMDRRSTAGRPLHLAGKSFQRRVGRAAAHLAENEKAGLALDHRDRIYPARSGRLTEPGLRRSLTLSI